MPKLPKKLKLSEADLKVIYGKDYRFFRTKILSNCFCGNCGNSKNSTVIADYQIFLNELNDISLEGHCKTCGQPVGRYIETGELPKYAARIKKVRGKTL